MISDGDLYIIHSAATRAAKAGHRLAIRTEAAIELVGEGALLSEDRAQYQAIPEDRRNEHTCSVDPHAVLAVLEQQPAPEPAEA